MKGKKRTVVMVLIIFLVNSIATFAEMPNATVVIGKSGYSLEYVNNKNNQREIGRLINNAKLNGQDIFIKNGRGQWFKNNSSERISKEALPWVVYTNDKGIDQLFHKGDGDKIAIGNFFEGDGTQIYEIHTDEDIYIKERDILFKDSSVDGTIFIDSGEYGRVVLENVKAKNIRIVSSGIQRIYFKNVRTEQLIVDGISEVKLIVDNKTRVRHATIMSEVSIDSDWGYFNEIEISMNESVKYKSVELIGAFNNKIIVKSDVELKASEVFGTRYLDIEPKDNKQRITLRGKIDYINVNKESNIGLIDATVKRIRANSNLKLNVNEKSKVRELDEMEYDVLIEKGKENIGN